MNKIFQGDCVEVMKGLQNESVDLILTDPPYEVNYAEKSKHLAKIQGGYEKQMARDTSFVDAIVNYEVLAKEFFRLLKNDSHCYIFCGDRQIGTWQKVMVEAGFKNPQVLVWLKENATFDLTFGHKFLENKEFILFFHKGWKKLNTYGVERAQFRSVLEFKKSNNTDLHSCAKPIDLLYFLVKLSSNKGDVCFDPFMGSGNHIIAFKRLERQFIGCELSEVYFKNIEKRLQEESEQKKLLEVF